MEIRIREANQKDYRSIYELNKSGLGYDFDSDKTAQRMKCILEKADHRLLIAEIEQEVVGYIHASSYDCTYSDPVKNILALAVDCNRRGSGIGRRLLTAIEEWAREEGCAAVRLVSGYDREGAHRFYHACGYVHRKDQKNFVKELRV